MELARAGMDPARGGAWAPAAEVWLLGEDYRMNLAGALAEDLAVAGVLAVAGALVWVLDRDFTRSVIIINIVNMYS